MNTLLHRKRGAYGPLWIFELDPETWAIVWSGWLEDEVSCHLILSEDPQWFKRDWGMDGRRPNPTYKTQRAALEEVIRSLRAMKVDLEPNEAEDRKYALYISDAEHDLRLLMNEQSDESQANEDTVQEPEKIPTSPEALGEAQVVAPIKVAVKVEQAPPAPASQAVEPWGQYMEEPKGLNFKPDMTLHAKMTWVCNHIPRMSRLRILRDGATMLCDQLIATNYRDEE
ncbi:hypothetical protein QPK31_24120 [Massilia sp. YIM B02769]|uniref:hypothetical protein n=1 Tax=Massilia sp. YIM B02769 TaxID=3050129 RepID=UPI0025B66842|nr:hypothetical protein [Massilia sp. YIM B02769]MDN4061311.1 hypothetical protein [Massilia sp. YIM B02769]